MTQQRLGPTTLAILLGGAATTVLAAQAPPVPVPVPVAAFAAAEQFRNVQLSPEGDYVSAVRSLGDHSEIVVLRLPDSTPVGRYGLEHGAVANYWWVGSQRLIVAPARYFGSYAAPVPTGELIGFDADGSHGQYLYGRVNAKLSNIAWRADANIIDPLPSQPRKALVQTTAYARDQIDAPDDVAVLDTYTGRLSGRIGAPLPGEAYFLADAAGDVRFAVGSPEPMRYRSYIRSSGDTDWHPFGGEEGAPVIPLSISADGRQVFLRVNDAGRDCLAAQSLQTSERHVLSCDPLSSLEDILFSTRTRLPIAVRYEHERPHTDVLSLDPAWQKKYAALLKALVPLDARIVSMTSDERLALVFADSDRDPGNYYLFDTQTNEVEFLVAAREGIDPARMGERRPIRYAARDGTMIGGYLTLPPGLPAKNLPLVVLPHGGPYGIADIWTWDAEAQLLATRGYAVLQPNFRGSGGYGFDFMEAGRAQWDTIMVDDINDGARWAIAQGYANPGRLCIYGVSYGGYAAITAAEREPDLYRCVIAMAGVYDLNLLRSGGLLSGAADFVRSQAGREYFEAYIGDDESRLRQASPITHLDRLKAPVLIAHGKEDQRAPYNQATSLRTALDARRLPYEWFVRAGEGHGFLLQENRVAFYDALLDFLNRRIGTTAD